MTRLKKDDRKRISLLGAAHFLVDLACTALLTMTAGTLPYDGVIACALLYNGLAFAFQLPIGALGDCLGLQRGLAALGCLLVALGAWMPEPLLLCVAIGLGNACFHVGGGREALKRGGARAGWVGRFVAPGAIGIFLGPKLARLSWLLRWALPLCLLGLAAVLFLTRREGREAETMTLAGKRLPPARLAGVMGCMFLTVLLRSYMGTVLRYGFMANIGWAFCFTLCVFGGKYFGGILADRFGDLRFSIWAQVAAVVLFALSVRFPILAMPGIFLFNTTMAITAARLYTCAPGYPGTMFGLTTLALYLGVIPKLLGWKSGLFTWWGLGILSLISAGLLLSGLVLVKGGGYGRNDPDLPGKIPGADPAP